MSELELALPLEIVSFQNSAFDIQDATGVVLATCSVEDDARAIVNAVNTRPAPDKSAVDEAREIVAKILPPCPADAEYVIAAALAAREAQVLECLVKMVLEVGGLSTGHADTPEQLMAEVLEQVKELREKLKSLHAHCTAESRYWDGVARNRHTEARIAEKAKSLSAAYRHMGNRAALRGREGKESPKVRKV